MLRPCASRCSSSACDCTSQRREDLLQCGSHRVERQVERCSTLFDTEAGETGARQHALAGVSALKLAQHVRRYVALPVQRNRSTRRRQRRVRACRDDAAESGRSAACKKWRGPRRHLPWHRTAPHVRLTRAGPRARRLFYHGPTGPHSISGRITQMGETNGARAAALWVQ